MGFAPEVAQVLFPIPMFLAGSDLTPVKENFDKIVYGLTKWEPKNKEKKVLAPPKITVTGKDAIEAVANMNLLFLKNQWSDGLPVQPATEDRVKWILTGTDRKPDEVVSTIPPRGGIATVEQVAVVLAMAGGRPEYMPLLLASIDAMLKTTFEGWTSTTCATVPAVIVDGPMAAQIRLNSGYGVLSPDPVHPAGASIGRALRLLMLDLGGAVPANGTMSIYGGPARYTGLVFAEDEEGLPKGWNSVAEDRGFKRGQNVVTVHAVASGANIVGSETGTKEQTQTALDRMAGFMGAPNGNYYSGTYDGAPGVMLVARGTAQGLVNFGWTKDKVKTFLWENSKIARSKLNGLEWFRIETFPELGKELFTLDPIPITRKPENIIIGVAGGAQSGHAYWMEVGCCPKGPASAEITLPKNWDALLKQAEADLGPIPAPMK